MPSIGSPDDTFGLSPGYFHADPHPGNILATQAGELVYLDFGMMSEAPLSARSFFQSPGSKKLTFQVMNGVQVIIFTDSH